MAATWGNNTWGANSWQSETVTNSLTAPATLTSSIGSLTAFNEEGWGRQEWGNSGWGVEYSVALSGLSLTSSLGSPSAAQEIPVPLTAPSSLTSSVGSIVTGIGVPITAPSSLTTSVGAVSEDVYATGWGRDDWGHEPWGDTHEPVITLTGLGLTSSVGDLSAFNEQGWGRDPWGYENWGESAMTVVVDVSSSGVATTGVGALSPTEMSIGLTGQSLTSSLGTPGLAFGVSTEPISGVSVTASVGAISPDADMAVGLSGLSATASVGAIAPADVMGLTGVSATASVGEVDVTPTELVNITAPSGLTVSLGTPIVEIGVPLTGLGVTASVGAITPADVMGLTGISATVSVGNVAPIGYNRITGTQSGNYSAVTGTQSGGYTRVDPA